MNRMYGSRRREARAINSRNLQWSESDLADIDYLGARGMSGSPLGANLERMKYGLDRSVYSSCVDLLSEKFQRRTRNRACKSLVHAALHEFLDDQCPACSGRAVIEAGDAETPDCAACDGSGHRRYTDVERAHAASVSIGSWRRHERDYLELVDC